MLFGKKRRVLEDGSVQIEERPEKVLSPFTAGPADVSDYVRSDWADDASGQTRRVVLNRCEFRVPVKYTGSVMFDVPDGGSSADSVLLGQAPDVGDVTLAVSILAAPRSSVDFSRDLLVGTCGEWIDDVALMSGEDTSAAKSVLEDSDFAPGQAIQVTDSVKLITSEGPRGLTGGVSVGGSLCQAMSVFTDPTGHGWSVVVKVFGRELGACDLEAVGEVMGSMVVSRPFNAAVAPGTPFGLLIVSE